MRNLLVLLLSVALLRLSPVAAARRRTSRITIKNHDFTPTELKVPANKRINDRSQ